MSKARSTDQKINRSKVRSTDQKLDQHIKHQIKRSKERSTDQRLDQQNISYSNILTAEMFEEQIQCRFHLNSIWMQLICNLEAF